MSLCSKCGGIALSASYDCRQHIRKEKIDDDPVICDYAKWRCMNCGSLCNVWQYSTDYLSMHCFECGTITLEDRRKSVDIDTTKASDNIQNNKLNGFNESDLALEVLLCAKIRNFLSNHDPRHWSDMREYIDNRESQLITRAQEIGIGQEIEAMISGAEIYFSHEVTD